MPFFRGCRSGASDEAEGGGQQEEGEEHELGQATLAARRAKRIVVVGCSFSILTGFHSSLEGKGVVFCWCFF